MDCFIGTMGIDIMLLGCTLGARYHFFIIYFLSALILYLSYYLRRVTEGCNYLVLYTFGNLFRIALTSGWMAQETHGLRG